MPTVPFHNDVENYYRNDINNYYYFCFSGYLTNFRLVDLCKYRIYHNSFEDYYIFFRLFYNFEVSRSQ